MPIRHQLLYLCYGNDPDYSRKAKFSLLTALSRCRRDRDFVIRLLTDDPTAFEGWPIDIVALDKSTLSKWQGAAGYHH